MSRRWLLLAICMVALGAGSSAVTPPSGLSPLGAGNSGPSSLPLHRDNELIVRFHPHTSPAEVERFYKQYATSFGIGLKEELDSDLADDDPEEKLLSCRRGDVPSLIRILQQDPRVARVEPNYIYHASIIPDDARFSELWNMDNTGQTGGTVGADIGAPLAWDLATGSGNIIIGVIDSGIDDSHEDLAANVWVNPGEIPGNGIDDDGNGYVDDI
ncbi:MAG: peptidase S8, partial [Acidobacteriota bacterium]